MTTKDYKRIVCPVCSRDNHLRPDPARNAYLRVSGCWCITNGELNELIEAGNFHAQRPIRERLRREALAKRENDPPDAHDSMKLTLDAILQDTTAEMEAVFSAVLPVGRREEYALSVLTRFHARTVQAVEKHVAKRYYPPLGLLDDAAAATQGATDDRGNRQQPPSDNEGRPKKRRSRRGRHKRPAIADPGANAG